MAIDEALSARVRDRLGGLEGLGEKKMFGGLCFLVNGHMVVAVSRKKTGEGQFLFRIGKDNADAAAELGQFAPMVHGGRTMSGFYHVDADDCPDAIFNEWISIAVENAYSLPPRT